MTTTTTTLTDFLLARIAEDEAVARVVRPDDHLTTRDRSFLHVESDNGYAHVAATSGRVLAECEAKRRIVELHTLREWSGWTYCAECNTTEGGTIYDVEKAGPCPTLRLLALPYADHPDYRPEWRP